MTVMELIEELKKGPSYYEVRQYDDSIVFEIVCNHNTTEVRLL
jgi:hypothetical protein